ncbi:MAG: hypothetical protein RRA15_08925 [bacterium]|nr:hypothetical protein [bacterium]MDT8366605.1 hypothetical protein [bacterium]
MTATLRNQSAVAYTVTDIYTTDSTGSPDNWSLANFPYLPFLLPAFGERTVDVTFMPQEELTFRTRIAIDFGAGLTYTSPGYMKGEGIAPSGGGGGGGGGGCSLSSLDDEGGIGPEALFILFIYSLCLWRRKRKA